VLGNVVKPMVGFVGKGASWAMGKAKAGASWVKGKAEAGAGWLKAKGKAAVDKVGSKFGPKPKPGAPGVGGDIEAEAERRVAARTRGSHTVEEIRRAIGEVESELRPMGLRRLELGPESGDHGYPLIVQRMMKFLPRVTKAYVRMKVELTVAGEAAPLEGVQHSSMPRGFTSRGHPIPGTLYPSSPWKELTGGFLMPTKEPDKVELQTYNSNDNPMSTDNGTHAETQFATFMRDNDQLRGRTHEVKIQINKSPCPRCAEMLQTLVSLFPPGTKFSLKYATLYSNEVITEDQTLAGLGGMENWRLSGPRAPKKVEKELVGSRS
jgi:hypothetical protein